MARAYRPRRTTADPLEVLRLLVDEHLADDPARPVVRPAWDVLDEQRQGQVVQDAMRPEAIEDHRARMVGAPCARPLVGAVWSTLATHAPPWEASA